MINFVLFRAMPGSPERIILRGTPNVTQEMPGRSVSAGAWTSRSSRTSSWPTRGDAPGDLGFSFVARGQTVSEVPSQKIWPTVILFGLGEFVAIVVGLALGAYTGWKRGGPVDYLGNRHLAGPLLDALLPARDDADHPVLVGAGLVPAVRDGHVRRPVTTASSTALADFGSHLVLPLLTVALGLVGQYAIVMRSSIVETMNEDYITTARGMGLKDRRILRHHAFPNALLPTVSLVAINLGYVVAGSDHGRGRLQLAGPRDADGRGADGA